MTREIFRADARGILALAMMVALTVKLPLVPLYAYCPCIPAGPCPFCCVPRWSWGNLQYAIMNLCFGCKPQARWAAGGVLVIEVGGFYFLSCAITFAYRRLRSKGNNQNGRSR